MMTFDSIYGKSAPTQPVIEELPQTPQGQPIFILHEAGVGSKVLATGKDYNEMYANAAQLLGMPETELRKAGYKFSVEHREYNSTETRGDRHGLEPDPISVEVTQADPVHVAAREGELALQKAAALKLKRQQAMAKARAAKAAKKAGKSAEEIQQQADALKAFDQNMENRKVFNT